MTAAHVDFAPVRVQNAVDQVLAQLKAAILSGQLRPGDRLPPESELAARFGVSRQVLREALKVLAASSLVVSARGRGGGTFVAHPASEAAIRSLAETLHLMLDLDRISLAEIVEARRVVEATCAQLAARRRTDEDLVAMCQALEQAEARPTADEAWLDLDVVFHRAEASAAHNRMLVLPLASMHAVVQPRLNRLIFPLLDRRTIEGQHRAIFEAIRDQAPERAEQAVRRHLDHLGALYSRLPVLNL